MATTQQDLNDKLRESTESNESLSQPGNDSASTPAAATPDPAIELRRLNEENEKLRQRIQQLEAESVTLKTKEQEKEKKEKEENNIFQIKNYLEKQLWNTSLKIQNWKKVTDKLLIDCTRDHTAANEREKWETFVYIAKATETILPVGRAMLIALTYGATEGIANRLMGILDIETLEEEREPDFSHNTDNQTPPQNTQQLLEAEVSRLRDLKNKKYCVIEGWEKSIEKLLQACAVSGKWHCFMVVAKAYSQLLPPGAAMFPAISGVAPVEIFQELRAKGLFDFSLSDEMGLTPLMRLAEVTSQYHYDKLKQVKPVFRWMVNNHSDPEFFNKTWRRISAPEVGPTALDIALTAQNWPLIKAMCFTPELYTPLQNSPGMLQVLLKKNPVTLDMRFNRLQAQFKKTQAAAAQEYSFRIELDQSISRVEELPAWKAHKTKMLKDATYVREKWASVCSKRSGISLN